MLVNPKSPANLQQCLQQRHQSSAQHVSDVRCWPLALLCIIKEHACERSRSSCCSLCLSVGSSPFLSLSMSCSSFSHQVQGMPDFGMNLFLAKARGMAAACSRPPNPPPPPLHLGPLLPQALSSGAGWGTSLGCLWPPHSYVVYVDTGKHSLAWIVVKPQDTNHSMP